MLLQLTIGKQKTRKMTIFHAKQTKSVRLVPIGDTIVFIVYNQKHLKQRLANRLRHAAVFYII